jgi:hypothetical protein
MRIGYSMLLGEHINAPFVSYEDCRPFQIVCPSCKEPVFKVIREQGEHPLHYLSHYAQSEAYAPDCELRVAGMSAGDLERQNAIGRGQRLELFLKVLRDLILSSQYDDANRDKAENFARKLRQSKGLKQYRNMMFEHLRETSRLSLEEADQYLEEYVADVTSGGEEFPATAFALHVQKRIAWDIWTNITTPVARDNYMFLFSHAALHLLTRIDLAGAARALYSYERMIHAAIRELAEVHIKDGDRILRELAWSPLGPPHALDEDSNVLVKMSGEITHEMLGILLRLPYFTALKNAQGRNDSASKPATG